MVAVHSLYRRYRPQTFAELVGQEHVTAALRNALHEGRVGHAYLFSGPRGTGKTTTARILAKALNCTGRDPHGDGEPCDKCTSCQEITAGTSLDVIEQDAASRNQVNDMRDLLERVAYQSAGGAKKIYILDEVHMLGPGATAALLKTLEEPPDHVVFVLATTNPEKVLPTIRSRTQHFEFTLLNADQLTGHLADIAAREGVEIAPDMLGAVARRASGSARDALSLLDQVFAVGDAGSDAAATLVGTIPEVQRTAVLSAVAGQDVPGALLAAHDLLSTGTDPRTLAAALLAHLRDAFVYSASAGRVVPEVPQDSLPDLEALATAFGNAGLVRALETLGAAEVDMRQSPDARLVLEIAIVCLARRDSGTSLSAITERLERLEGVVAGLREGGTSAPILPTLPTPALSGNRTGPQKALGASRKKVEALSAATGGDVTKDGATKGGAAKQGATLGAAISNDMTLDDLTLDDVVTAWAKILPILDPQVSRDVEDAQPIALKGEVVEFGVVPSLMETIRPRFKEHAKAVRSALVDVLGIPLKFQLVESDLAGLGAPIAVPAKSPQDQPIPDEPSIDPVAHVMDALGGVVIDERPV